jgi:pSer/pThr/pTyr-binding forkhead associated (FHA) protein
MRAGSFGAVKNPPYNADESSRSSGLEGFRAMTKSDPADSGSATRKRPPTGASAIVLSGFYEGLEILLDRERIVIGRGRKADLALAEVTISRAHAALGFDGQGFFVEDLGSTNGTMVNGSRIAKQHLKTEDEIQMGKLRIGVTLP